jgi:hypothetical protein
MQPSELNDDALDFVAGGSTGKSLKDRQQDAKREAEYETLPEHRKVDPVDPIPPRKMEK